MFYEILLYVCMQSRRVSPAYVNHESNVKNNPSLLYTVLYYYQFVITLKNVGNLKSIDLLK